MKKIVAILASAVCINANSQIVNTLARNGLPKVDTTGTGNDTLTIGPNGQCFAKAVNYPAGSYLSSICAADFNNDGKVDLATANTISNNVSVLLGTGIGTFGPVTNFSIGASGASNFGTICTADFNSDGYKDIAVTNVSYGAVYILLGTGTGNFGAPSNFTVAVSNPYSLISADFNGDNNADLALTSSNSNYISVFLGSGLGSFSAATNFNVGVNPRSIVCRDFNGDTKPDLAVANSGSNSVSILLGNGGGGFGSASNFGLGGTVNPLSVTSADFDNDGKLDLAATDGADTICVLLGTGTGSFGTSIMHHTGGMGSIYQGCIISADFNMDGNADLATSDYAASSGYASVLLGNGNGTFGAAGNFATGTNPFGIVAADFNLDGKPDLATANESSNNISILINNPLDSITISASATTLCGGSSSILTASGSATYNWSTGATTSTISVAPVGTTVYSVTDGVGCSNTASITINVPTIARPDICMVTTDSASNYNYNVIAWDKTLYTNVDSFIVYRYDVMSSSYLRIGAVSKDSLSEFKDTSFNIGGPNGGSPLYSSWQYKLAIRDTCGNIGAKSPYHQSMFVQESGATFSWNAYTVETGQANPVTGYSFLRDDNNTGAWHVLVNTAGLSTTDPNYSSYPNGNWRVDALGFNCIPTMFVNGNSNTLITKNKSHSNTSKPAGVGMNQLDNVLTSVKIYPNPSSDNVIILSSTELGTIMISNSLGEIILKTNSSDFKYQADISKFSKGIYIVNVGGKNMKLIKE